jgi:CRISPR-associated protein Cmr3
MNHFTHRFIEPLDVLFLRGNKLFGGPGSFGESMVPPWPSAAAGAIRSLILALDGIDPSEFARGRHLHPFLGTPAEPGSFRVTAFQLAQIDAGGAVSSLHPLPADHAVREESELVEVARVIPVRPYGDIMSSSTLPMLPVLPQSDRAKRAGRRWVTQDGWQRYLDGNTIGSQDLIASDMLWALDARVGVGLDSETGRADDGKLFSAQAVAFKPGVGFIVTIAGADVPASGTLRLGGDGRGAALTSPHYVPAEAPFARIAQARRARVVLTSPGVFPGGWRLPGADEDGHFELGGVRARVVSAAVPRSELISGWDLALRAPKPALRVAPAGAVYWLEDLEASEASLRKLAEEGLWSDGSNNPHRRAEGFNRFCFAIY